MLGELRQLKSGPRECRRFGLALGLVLVGLGLWLGWRQHAAAAWAGGAGLLLALLGGAAPGMLRWLYLVWMTMGWVLGTIVSTIVLGVFFLGVVSPMGIIARLSGRDFLQLKPDPHAGSYWRRRNPAQPTNSARYEQQF